MIFIDVNLLTPEVPPLEKGWIKEAMQMFEHRDAEGLQNYDTALILTKFGWHFSRDEGSPSGENISARAEHKAGDARSAVSYLRRSSSSTTPIDSNWNLAGAATSSFAGT